MASKGVHQGFGRLHDAAFVAPRLHGRSVHREADARTRRQTFGVGRRPAQLHRVYLLVVFAGAVVDDVVENDVVGAAHVEGIIGGAEMRPVVFGGFAVGEFVQVVVVIADHAVNGDSERCELLPDFGEQLRRVPYDFAQQNRGLIDSLRFFCGRCGLQRRDYLGAEPFEMLVGLGLRVGDGQQFVTCRGSGPRLQFEVETFGRRGVGEEKLRDALFERCDVPRRGYDADE